MTYVGHTSNVAAMSNVRHMLTTAEAAAKLGIPRRRVLRLVQRGLLEPAERVGGGRFGAYMFDPAEVGRIASEGIPDRRYHKWREADR